MEMKPALGLGLALLVLVATPSRSDAGFIDIRVIQSSDDAEETVSSGSMNLTSSDMELVFDGSTQQLVGLRFQEVTIPQGATIVSAVLEFETDETDSGSTSVLIRGEDADDAATFTTTNSDISNRTTTTASVAWNSIPAWNTVDEIHQSPDVTSIVQEIVDRAGWASDNAMVFVIEAAASGCSSSACQRTAEAFDGESDAAPALRIEFDGVIPEPATSICYSVADSNDELKEIPTTGASAGSPTTVGDTEVSSVEALAYQVKHGVLYGADADQLGRINRNTGQFFALEETFGTGTATVGGSPTSVTFSDVDGLSFDPTTAVLYGTNASTGADELFVILFRTGEYLDDAFGTGEDFVELTGSGSDDIGSQVDDIAFDPDDNGQLYATDGDEIYTVNKATGATTLVGDLRVGSTTGTDITDMEGLSFDDSGQLYGTTGTSGPGSTRNRLWTIDKTDGVATQVGTGALGSGTDYESVECVFTSDLTYASVAGLRAYRRAGRTVVEWRTDGEAGTVGFRLLRSDDRNGPYERLGPPLLLGLLTAPQGGVYRFVDPGAETGETYWYSLVEVDAAGRRRTHGSFEVTVQPWPPEEVLSKADRTGIETSGFSRRPHPLTALPRPVRAPSRAAPPKARPGALLRGRVAVESSGLYFLSTDEMAGAFGLPISQMRRRITGGALRLSHGGLPVQAVREPGFDGLFFFGEAIDSVYTGENVYWLDLADDGEGFGDAIFADGFESGDVAAWSSCLPACSVPGSGRSSAGGAASFPDTIRFEEDRFPVTSVRGDPEDGFWFWAFISAGDPSFGSAVLDMHAAGVAPGGTARLVVELLGSSSSDATPDHHVTVHLNGETIGAGTWDGARRHTLDVPFEASLLRDGDNTVTVTGVLEDGVPFSIFYVDAVELTYPRRYVAVDDSLLLRGDGNARLTVEGFSSPDLAVFDLGNPRGPRRITDFTVDGSSGDYRLSFTPQAPRTPYLAIAPARATALPVTPFLQEDLRHGSAEYLVVTPDRLAAGARRLADYRAGRGLETAVVSLEEIYAGFAHGLVHPLAVRDFLSRAATAWQTPPRFLVLLGDGDFDYEDVLGLDENLIPPLLVATPWGLAGSDVALADFRDGDGVPDVAVGRLPARDAAELEQMIDKIIAYESSPGGTWRKHFVLVADDPGAAGDFSADSDAIAALLPPTVTHERIHLEELAPGAARDELLSRLDEGAVMVNYVGHGGVDRFADEGLLLGADVAGLANGDRLPVVTALSCLAGRFDLPGFASLGEALVRAENRGAIAFWGPALLSNNADAATLDRAFYQALFTPGVSTLGEAVVEAHRALAATGSADRALPFLYVLLGDPAIEVP